MASVFLNFIPPQEAGWTTLHIYEGASAAGPFTEIDSVASGTPNYISSYTTDQASSENDWFAIQWSNDKGAETELSEPIQGGTESLVGIIVQRMLLRDPTLNENIAAQVAEAAISDYYNVTDPFSIDPTTVSPKILEGLTLLGLVWSNTVVMASSSNAQKFTAGLVSMDTGSSSATRSQGNLDAMLKLANQMLGYGFSYIGQLKEIPVSSGYTQLITADLSRTMVEI